MRAPIPSLGTKESWKGLADTNTGDWKCRILWALPEKEKALLMEALNVVQNSFCSGPCQGSCSEWKGKGKGKEC